MTEQPKFFSIRIDLRSIGGPGTSYSSRFEQYHNASGGDAKPPLSEARYRCHVRIAGSPTEAVDVRAFVQHHSAMKTLSEIEKAVEKLSSDQKQELIEFLSALLQRESKGPARRDFAPAERAADLERWAGSHEPGPGLPDSALGRDAIYD